MGLILRSILLTALVWLFCQTSTVFTQLEITPRIFVGPSITNVILTREGVPVQFATPERPYFALAYHLGIESDLVYQEKYNFQASFFYEKIRNASFGFNKVFLPPENENINYLALSLGGYFKPLKGRNVRLGLGGNFYYALRLLNRGGFFFRQASLAAYTDLEVSLLEKFALRLRTIYGITDLEGGGNLIQIGGTTPTVLPRTIRFVSFQFSTIYKINIK